MRRHDMDYKKRDWLIAAGFALLFVVVILLIR